MKLMNYFQLALSILIFLGVIALIIRNIVIGNMKPLGIPFAASFLVLTGLLVLYAWAEVRNYENKEKKLKR